MEVTITSENFESLKNGEQPLVVDFWATWCGPCRMVGPVISELAEEYDGRIAVVTLRRMRNLLQSLVSVTSQPSCSLREVSWLIRW